MSAYNDLIEQAPMLVVAIPLLAAFATPIIGKLNQKFMRLWAFLGVAAVTAIMYLLAWEVLRNGGDEPITYIFGAQSLTGGLATPLPMGSAALTLPVRITFYVDGMSVFMGLIMATVGFAAILYSFSFMERYGGQEKYYTLLLLMLAANFGMVFTGDLFNLFVWFEISAVAVCGLTAFRTERGESFEGAIKYLIYSTVAGLFLLFAVGLLYGQYGHLNINYLSMAIAGNAEMMIVDKIALGLIVGVFALKAGAVPLHMATPDAYSEAPAPITAMFVTASQAGLYALFRAGFTLYGARLATTGDVLTMVGWALVILGVLSMFVGVTMALIQKDIKRLMAYHAISQTGYMLLGVGVGMMVLNDPEKFAEFGRMAMSGGIFHIFNHALYKGLLFLTAGAIIYKAGTRDLNRMGGLGRDMKMTAFFFIIGSLAIAGVPPMNGFASKFMIYEAVFKFNPVIGAIAMLVSLLTLASFVKVFYSAFMGPRNPDMSRGEVPIWMLVGMGILTGLIFVFSFAPALVVRSLVDPAVNSLAGVHGSTAASLTLFSGEGYWNAAVLAGAVAVALVVALAIRSMGRKGSTPKGEGKKPYLFGNPTEIDGKPIIIGGSNVYWGFTQALGRYYRPAEKLHSGIVNDYIFWLVSTFGMVIMVLVWV